MKKKRSKLMKTWSQMTDGKGTPELVVNKSPLSHHSASKQEKKTPKIESIRQQHKLHY